MLARKKKKRQKLSVIQWVSEWERERESEEAWTGEGKCWRIRKYEKRMKEKEWELSEEFERQEWSVKEGEVEQKMRQRERVREGIILFDRGGFRMGSWWHHGWFFLFFLGKYRQESRSPFHWTHILGNSKSAHVLAHTLEAVSTTFECNPKYAHKTHTHAHFLSLSPSLFPLNLYCSKKALGAPSLFQALCSFVFLSGAHSGICPSVPHTYIFSFAMSNSFSCELYSSVYVFTSRRLDSKWAHFARRDEWAPSFHRMCV